MLLKDALVKTYQRWVVSPTAVAIARSIRQQPEQWTVMHNSAKKQSLGDILIGPEHTIWISTGHWFVRQYDDCDLFFDDARLRFGGIGRYLVWFSFLKYKSAMGSTSIEDLFKIIFESTQSDPTSRAINNSAFAKSTQKKYHANTAKTST